MRAWRGARLTCTASPARVFEVLRDAGSYRHWVLRTTGIRDVDEGWPRVGTNLHYTVGRWPLRLHDRTTVRAFEPDRRLELEAHAQLAGTARIDIEVMAEGDGCRVVLDEQPISGAGARLHTSLTDVLLRIRNVSMMRRLRELAEADTERSPSA